MMNHWGIAMTLANEYRNIPRLEFDDILQQARIGLFKAAKKYNPNRGATFSTYAWHVIKNDLNTLYAKQQRYAQRETVSLDILASQSDEENESCRDLLQDEKEDVFKKIKFREEKKAVQLAISKLPDRQKKIIYGLLDGQDYRTIGKQLGFSKISAKTLVSRAYQRSLKNLKAELEKLKL